MTSYAGPVTFSHLDEVGRPFFWLDLQASNIPHDE